MKIENMSKLSIFFDIRVSLRYQCERYQEVTVLFFTWADVEGKSAEFCVLEIF